MNNLAAWHVDPNSRAESTGLGLKFWVFGYKPWPDHLQRALFFGCVRAAGICAVRLQGVRGFGYGRFPELRSLFGYPKEEGPPYNTDPQTLNPKP